MTVAVDRMKCACADCVCVISTKNGVEAGGRIFCGANARRITRRMPAATTRVAPAMVDPASNLWHGGPASAGAGRDDLKIRLREFSHSAGSGRPHQCHFARISPAICP